MTKKFSLLRSLLGVGLSATVALCQGCEAGSSRQQDTGDLEPTAPQVTTPAPGNSPVAECVSPEDSTDASTRSETTRSETTDPEPQYTVLNEQGNAEYEVLGNDVLQPATLPAQTIDFDEQAMLKVLQATRAYFAQHGCKDMKVLRSGLLGTQDVQHTDVLSTLDFMIKTLEEDTTAGVPTRLKDVAFINANFRVIRWLGFDPTYPAEDRLRITKYAVFTHPGSRQRTETFDTPVYALKNEGEDQSFITRACESKGGRGRSA